MRSTRRKYFAGAFAAATLLCVLPSSTPDKSAGLSRPDPLDKIRAADLSARQARPVEPESGITQGSTRPLLFPGSDVAPAGFSEPSGEPPPVRVASTSLSAAIGRDGVDINFEDADIPTVARSLLGD